MIAVTVVFRGAGLIHQIAQPKNVRVHRTRSQERLVARRIGSVHQLDGISH
jgi:hypothetical protein